MNAYTIQILIRAMACQARIEAMKAANAWRENRGEPIHIISLGAGVQSSTMALMAAHGELTPTPVAAVFADTQAEPKSVYKWLDWLEKQLPFPVHRVTKGNLAEVALKIHNKKDGTGKWAESLIPAFIKNPDGSRGMIQRQCTYNYKVIPLHREALKIMKKHKAESARMWIGISLDEAHRMKPSRDERIVNCWPLIDHQMRRYDCLRWMKTKGYPQPPRSACVYCPFHSDAEWRRLRDEEPEAWEQAVKFDEEFRNVKEVCRKGAGQPYLHSSLKPLTEVDLRTDEDKGQQVLFGNECEGLCGV